MKLAHITIIVVFLVVVLFLLYTPSSSERYDSIYQTCCDNSRLLESDNRQIQQWNPTSGLSKPTYHPTLSPTQCEENRSLSTCQKYNDMMQYIDKMKAWEADRDAYRATLYEAILYPYTGTQNVQKAKDELLKSGRRVAKFEKGEYPTPIGMNSFPNYSFFVDKWTLPSDKRLRDVQVSDGRWYNMFNPKTNQVKIAITMNDLYDIMNLSENERDDSYFVEGYFYQGTQGTKAEEDAKMAEWVQNHPPPSPPLGCTDLPFDTSFFERCLGRIVG